MQPSPPHGARFRLKKRLSAVKLHPNVDRAIDNEGVAVQIPTGQVVAVDGEKQISGMRNVVWNGEMYAVFEQDLLANSEPV